MSTKLDRFTGFLRSRGEVTSSSVNVSEETVALDVELILKKRNRKQTQTQEGEKTVADLISDISSTCSKQEKQMVRLHVIFALFEMIHTLV